MTILTSRFYIFINLMNFYNTSMFKKKKKKTKATVKIIKSMKIKLKNFI